MLEAVLIGFELYHPDGVVRLVQGMSSRVHNGNVFQPAGSILRVSSIPETTETKAHTLSVSIVGMPVDNELLGINQSTYDALVNPAIRYSEGFAYLYIINADTDEIVDSYAIFSGYVNKASVNLTLGIGVVSMYSAEGLSKNSFGYSLTQQHHQTIYPTDKALNFASYDFISLSDPE